jgi:hypothetical protein
MLPVRRAAFTDCIVVAVAFALIAGLAEVLLLESRRLVFGGFTFSGLQAIWMAPTAYLIAFVLPALLAALFRGDGRIRIGRRWLARAARA